MIPGDEFASNRLDDALLDIQGLQVHSQVVCRKSRAEAREGQGEGAQSVEAATAER